MDARHIKSARTLRKACLVAETGRATTRGAYSVLRLSVLAALYEAELVRDEDLRTFQVAQAVGITEASASQVLGALGPDGAKLLDHRKRVRESRWSLNEDGKKVIEAAVKAVEPLVAPAP